jgi:hypothetical protein
MSESSSKGETGKNQQVIASKYSQNVVDIMNAQGAKVVGDKPQSGDLNNGNIWILQDNTAEPYTLKRITNFCVEQATTLEGNGTHLQIQLHCDNYSRSMVKYKVHTLILSLLGCLRKLIEDQDTKNDISEQINSLCNESIFWEPTQSEFGIQILNTKAKMVADNIKQAASNGKRPCILIGGVNSIITGADGNQAPELQPFKSILKCIGKTITELNGILVVIGRGDLDVLADAFEDSKILSFANDRVIAVADVAKCIFGLDLK